MSLARRLAHCVSYPSAVVSARHVSACMRVAARRATWLPAGVACCGDLVSLEPSWTSTQVRVIVVFMTAATTAATCAPGRPELAGRELISPAQAARLEGVFKMLANDTRLRLLHALVRAGQLCVSDLAETVGMRPQAVSN